MLSSSALGYFSSGWQWTLRKRFQLGISTSILVDICFGTYAWVLFPRKRKFMKEKYLKGDNSFKYVILLTI